MLTLVPRAPRLLLGVLPGGHQLPLKRLGLLRAAVAGRSAAAVASVVVGCSAYPKLTSLLWLVEAQVVLAGARGEGEGEGEEEEGVEGGGLSG